MSEITIANNPLPQKHNQKAKKPTFNTKWSRIFKQIQDTGKRQELISPDGFFTTGQYVSVTQCAKNWSNRNGFGKIKVQSRTTRVSTTGPRHLQYQYRIWVTVPKAKSQPESQPVEKTMRIEQPPLDAQIQRLIDQIAGRR